MRQLRRHPLERRQHADLRCGDDHRVIEVDGQGSVVWQVTEHEIPGNQLGFAAGLQRLPNGNTIICNWPGHGGVPANQPQAFELHARQTTRLAAKKPRPETSLEPRGRRPRRSDVDGVVYRQSGGCLARRTRRQRLFRCRFEVRVAAAPRLASATFPATSPKARLSRSRPVLRRAGSQGPGYGR